MKLIRWFVLGVVLSALTGCVSPEKWHPATGPLKTRWTDKVSSEHPWPEYPRPQMVRERWMNLNGLWDYAIAQTNVAPGASDGKILVPFPIESALSGVMKPLDQFHHLVYRRTFKLPVKWRKERVLLHFGAVDWKATVTVNNMQMGIHRGGYDPFTFDITPALVRGREQQIQVDVFDPTEAGQPRGKQVRHPQGIVYTSTSGIWQTVWLEPVPRSSLGDLNIVPDIDAGVIRLKPEVAGGDGAESIEAVAYDKGREVGRASAAAGSELSISIPNANLWTPGHPFLYGLKVELRRHNTPVDSVSSYFAMRKISIGKDENGITRPLLNGHFVFQLGPLDQGFWPDGIYTAPTDDALRYDLEMTKKLGFNMTRKHVKVEPERWYYDCDKLGLLVWQDMPSGNNTTAADKAEFEQELRRMIATHHNHPCIVMWVVFNEGWGQFDTARLTSLVKQLDPSRLVDDATGWTDMRAGDVIDMHKYPGPGSPQPEAHRAAVLGEFGGLGLAIPGHTWSKKSWGYQGMGNRQALTDRYVQLLDQVNKLKRSPGLSAAVYTQITDVETECNGLMTYDRAILKPNLKAASAANRKAEDMAPWSSLP